MSTPLPPPSPPGGNYYAPPVRPPSGSAGCWKAAGLTCGVLFLLVLIGGVLLVRTAKENFAHPRRGSIIGSAVLVVRASQEGAALQKAIVQYHRAHGHYPSSLLDLVREGRINGKLLHNDLDPNPSPGSISWQYSKPGPGVPGSATLLTEHYVLDIPGARGQAGNGAITITLDGQTGSTSGGSARPTFGGQSSGP